MFHGNDRLINLAVGAVVVNKNRALNGARFCFAWLGWLESNQRPID